MWRVAGFSRPYKSSQADRVSGIDILRRYRGNISLSVEAKSVGATGAYGPDVTPVWSGIWSASRRPVVHNISRFSLSTLCSIGETALDGVR